MGDRDSSPAPEAFRIVVADDHPLFREGVVKTISDVPGLEVVGEAASGRDALAVVEELLPDVAVLDVSMPDGGLWCAEQIAKRCPAVKTVMLTVAEDPYTVRGALKAGAQGYVLKGISGRELIEVLRGVANGEPYVTPMLAASMLQEAVTPHARDADRFVALTNRERDILKQLAKGASNKRIALNLSIGERTVKHHMTNILQKLQVQNRVEAALLAQQLSAAGGGPATERER